MPFFKTRGTQWFFEGLYPDIGYGFEVSNVLFGPKKSDFQEVTVLETPSLGRVLVLDDVVQFSERDERIYHEMMAHPVVDFSLSRSERMRIMIIGGGDGGIVRELLKHESVGEIIVVDIDPLVTEVSKRYFSDLFEPAFSDPCVRFEHMDAAKRIQQEKGSLDAVIVDSTDPVEFAVSLFGKRFVGDVYRALRPGGVCIRHGGSLLLQSSEFRSVWNDMASVFGQGGTQAFIFAPLSYFGGYFTGIISLKLPGSEEWPTPFTWADRRYLIETEWYSPEFFRACFSLPRCIFDGSVIGKERKA